MSNKIFKDIPRMVRNIKVIEQYNNFMQLGATEEINYLKERVNKLLTIKDIPELIKEFTWCAKMSNMFYDEIDPEFKINFTAEEKKKEQDNF